MQSAVLLQREALTITQRNVNRSFSLLKKFIGIRNFGTIVDLEVAYWPDRLMAFGGQLEELSALSAKALWDVLDVMVASARYRFAAKGFDGKAWLRAPTNWQTGLVASCGSCTVAEFVNLPPRLPAIIHDATALRLLLRVVDCAIRLGSAMVCCGARLSP